MSYFKGKTVIVTGASSGIGEATAKEFLSQGAKVILVARSESKMQDLSLIHISEPTRPY